MIRVNRRPHRSPHSAPRSETLDIRLEHVAQAVNEVDSVYALTVTTSSVGGFAIQNSEPNAVDVNCHVEPLPL